MHKVDAKLRFGVLFRDAELRARHVLHGANWRHTHLEDDGTQVPALVVRVYSLVKHRQASAIHGDRFVPIHRNRAPPRWLVFVACTQRFGGRVRLCRHKAQKFERLCGIGRRVDADTRALGANGVDVKLRTNGNDCPHRRILFKQCAQGGHKHVHGGRRALGEWLYSEALFGVVDFVLTHGDIEPRMAHAWRWAEVKVHATRGTRKRESESERMPHHARQGAHFNALSFFTFTTCVI